MSRSIGSTGDFARLFKNTKLAQVPRKLGELGYDRTMAYPTHQVIESLPSSFSRKDFGLKARLPKKLKTRYIIYNDLDNKYQLPDFEPLNNFFRKKQKFQELGIPVQSRTFTLSQRSTSSPLFPSSDKSTSQQTTKNSSSPFPIGSSQSSVAPTNTISNLLGLEKQSVHSRSFNKLKAELRTLAKPFKEWLVQNYPEKINSDDLNNEIIEFLSTTDYKDQFISKLSNASNSTIPKAYSDILSGTAGLSYNLRGRIFQTPNGAVTKKVFPGRIIANSQSGFRLGLGGFIGSSLSTGGSLSSKSSEYLSLRKFNAPLNDQGMFNREFKIPVAPKAAYVNLNTGRLNFEFQAVRGKKEDSIKSAMSDIRKNAPRAPLPGTDSNSTSPVLGSLLNMLQAQSRKKN